MIIKFQKNRFCRFIFALAVSLFLTQSLIAASRVEDRAKKEQMLEMYQAYKSKSFPNIPDISVEEYLKLKKEEKVVLVDVREPREQEVSMIPGAITKKEFEKDIKKYKNNIIVLYCTIGYRSGLYTQKLVKKNYKVMNLIGSVLAWAHAGQPFIGPKGETRRVHVYGKKWNLLPRGYEGVW